MGFGVLGWWWWLEIQQVVMTTAVSDLCFSPLSLWVTSEQGRTQLMQGVRSHEQSTGENSVPSPHRTVLGSLTTPKWPYMSVVCAITHR